MDSSSSYSKAKRIYSLSIPGNHLAV